MSADDSRLVPHSSQHTQRFSFYRGVGIGVGSVLVPVALHTSGIMPFGLPSPAALGVLGVISSIIGVYAGLLVKDSSGTEATK